MKLEMDEKLKHRLIGLAVIISLGAIFAPAMMKKSSLEHTMNVTVTLPQKPVAPNVAITDEKEVFKTIKVARVAIQTGSEKKPHKILTKAVPLNAQAVHLKSEELVQALNTEPKTQLIQLALHEAASHATKTVMQQASSQQIAQITPLKHPLLTKTASQKSSATVLSRAKPATVQQAHRTSPVNNKSLASARNKVIKQDMYAVQLASFSQLTNAQALINKLKMKGYKATVTKVPTRQGNAIYKVYVGHSPRKTDVLKLKNQLASAVQINGFVVNTGVS